MAVSVFFQFAGSILCGLLLCSGLLIDFFRLRRESKRLEEMISQQKRKIQEEEPEKSFREYNQEEIG